MEMKALKSAKEFWREKFDEDPQTDADKLAVAMMAEYGQEVSKNLVKADISKTKPEVDFRPTEDWTKIII